MWRNIPRWVLVRVQDDFGDLIANEEAEAAQEEGSHLRSAYQRASRHDLGYVYGPG